MVKMGGMKSRKDAGREPKPGKKAMIVIAVGKPKKGGMKKDCK